MYRKAKFKFLNFTPRAGVADRLNQILQDMVDSTPEDSTCTATIERKDQVFSFEVVLLSTDHLFYSQLDVDTYENLCRHRQWQAVIVLSMYSEILEQIGDWHRLRFAA